MFISSLSTSKIHEPPSSVLNFVKEFVNQLGVSKTLALTSSFPHELAHYHADFQCFVTVLNSVLLQGVFICLPHSKCCVGEEVNKKDNKMAYKCTTSLT